jgi:hypothetical protein
MLWLLEPNWGIVNKILPDPQSDAGDHWNVERQSTKQCPAQAQTQAEPDGAAAPHQMEPQRADFASWPLVQRHSREPGAVPAIASDAIFDAMCASRSM